MTPIRVIAIVGPTASGKTDLGLKLADEIGGEIISADSMQIYRWMDIGTAKPSQEILSSTPHHLIDILNPDQGYNAGKFAIDAKQIITKLHKEQKTAILLGGTGLYLRALFHGIIPVPDISPKVKEEVREMMECDGVQICHQKLMTIDPESAETLHPNDIARVTRALEVKLETGKSIREYQNAHQFRQQEYEVFQIANYWSREQLYERINLRVHWMVRDGLIEEVEKLLEMGYSPDLPSMNSIGYKQTVAHILGTMNREEMIEDIQQKSRRYAKKQLTWHRKDDSIHWLRQDQNDQIVFDQAKAFLGGE